MDLSLLDTLSLSQMKGRISGLFSTEPGAGCIHVLVGQRLHLSNTSPKDAQILGVACTQRTQEWGMMTFLSNPTVLAHLGRRLIEVCSVLFQPEGWPKERLASCIRRAPRAARWCFVAWTCCWTALPLGCTYRLHLLLALLLEEGWASVRTFAGTPVCREREASGPVSRTLHVCHPHPTMTVPALGKGKRQGLGILITWNISSVFLWRPCSQTASSV